MTRDLVREIGRERAAEARRRGLLAEARLARRSRRRAEREVRGRWWRRRPRITARRPVLGAAPAAQPEDVTAALAVLLEASAEQIAAHGTATERLALHAVHDVARWSAPGAAAALVDWDGSETARLRAFGVLHGVVLGVLGPEDQAWLLAWLQDGGTGQVQDDRVA
jgi:hypothetical protein